MHKDFPELFRQYQYEERTTIQVDTQGRLMLSPELEQFLRQIVREEVNKAMGEATRRVHGGEALETK